MADVVDERKQNLINKIIPKDDGEKNLLEVRYGQGLEDDCIVAEITLRRNEEASNRDVLKSDDTLTNFLNDLAKKKTLSKLAVDDFLPIATKIRGGKFPGSQAEHPEENRGNIDQGKPKPEPELAPMLKKLKGP